MLPWRKTCIVLHFGITLQIVSTESVRALVSLNCFSNSTTFKLFYFGIQVRANWHGFMFCISVHTTVHVPWEIFAYENPYDVVWIQSWNFIAVLILATLRMKMKAAYSCISFSDRSFLQMLEALFLSKWWLLKPVEKMADMTCYDIRAQYKHAQSCIFASNFWIALHMY